MKSEKPVASNNGSIIRTVNELTMNNNTTNTNKIQFNSRRELLEHSKLSRRPKYTAFKSSDLLPPISATVACIVCDGRFENDNDFQQSIKVCRKCLAHYAKIETAIDESVKRKKRELLEKFTLEVQR